MEAKVNVAKQFIAMTKEREREKERKEAIITVFRTLFNFLPDELEWVNDCGKKILEASARVEEEELEKKTILGEKVKEVNFNVIEDQLVRDLDLEWKFTQFTHGVFTVYKFYKRLPGYRTWVEIMTK